MKDSWSPLLPYLLFLPLTERTRIRASTSVLDHLGHSESNWRDRIDFPSAGDGSRTIPVERLTVVKLQEIALVQESDNSAEIFVVDERSWRHLRRHCDETRLLRRIGGVVVLRQRISPGRLFQGVPGFANAVDDREPKEDESVPVPLRYDVRPSLVRPRQLVCGGSVANSISSEGHGRIKGLIRTMVRRRRSVEIYCDHFDNSPLFSVLREVLGETPSVTEVWHSIRNIYISATGTMVVCVTQRDVTYYCRIPLIESACERVQNHINTLTALQEGGQLIGVPGIIQVKATDPPVLVEEGLAGESVEEKFVECKASVAQAYFTEALERIASLHVQFGRVCTLDADGYKQFIGSKIEHIARCLQGWQLTTDDLEWMSKFFWKEIGGSQQLVGIVHGDFKIGNCLFDESGSLTGIVDWDLSALKGLSVVDPASFWGRAVRGRQALLLPDLLTAETEEALALFEVMDSWFEWTGSARVELGVMARLYWLDRVYKQLKFGSGDQHLWCKQNVLPVITADRW